jgi:alpha-L-fucosidase
VFKLLPPIPDTSPGATRSSGRRDSGSKPYTSQDVRFTTKGSALYAFVLGRPSEPRVQIASLATTSPQLAGRKVADVSLLGYGKLKWSQTAAGLTVNLPEQLPSEHAITLKIAGVVGA